jgi:hypothetical protein
VIVTFKDVVAITNTTCHILVIVKNVLMTVVSVINYSKMALFFRYSAGLLLLFTAIAKIVSACGSARILQTPDPVLSIPFQDLFWIVGSLELLVAFFCLWGKRLALPIGLVAWLATNFLAYRIALVTVDWHKPCSCLGNLTDALHISPQTADTAMKIILAYLLMGSYATLFWIWRQPKMAGSSAVGAASL